MWEAQWSRVQRSFGEFQLTDQGRVHDRDSEYYLDYALHFFEDCYHLKDWLKNDPGSAAAAADVETMISNSEPLKLCADLSNGAKHLKLTKSRTGDKATAFGPKHFKVGLSTGMATTASVSYEVLSNGGTYDAFNIASVCMDEWGTYLTSKGLIK